MTLCHLDASDPSLIDLQQNICSTSLCWHNGHNWSVWQAHEAIAIPVELWRLVLQHLSGLDRIRVRPVCQAFHELEQQSHLECTTHIGRDSRACSFMLFLAQQSRQPRASLKLALVVNDERDDPFWRIPGVMAAAACSSLRSLQLAFFLSLHEAATMLNLLPSSLDCLKLSTHPEIVTSPGFQRLQNLRCLNLTLDIPGVYDHSACYYPSGLISLHHLVVLEIIFALDTSNTTIDGRGWGLPRLQRLGFTDIPFSMHFDIASFPCLQQIDLLDEATIASSWLRGHAINHLSCDTLDQFTACCWPPMLRCKELSLRKPSSEGRQILLEELNDMPCLKKLTLGSKQQQATAGVGPCLLKGTQAAFQQLIQDTQLVLNMDTNLMLMPEGTMVQLGQSSHPLQCSCAACQPTTRHGMAA